MIFFDFLFVDFFDLSEKGVRDFQVMEFGGFVISLKVNVGSCIRVTVKKILEDNIYI